MNMLTAEENALIILIRVLGFFVILADILLATKNKNGISSVNYFNFNGLFYVAFIWIYITVPTYQLLSPDSNRFITYGYSFLSEIYVATLNIVFIGSFIFCSRIINKLAITRAIKRICFFNSSSILSGFKKSYFFLFIAMPAAVATFICLNNVFSHGVAGYMVNRIELLRGYGIAVLLVNLLTFVGMFMFYRYQAKKNIVNLCKFVFISILIIIIYLILGSRNSVLLYFLCILISYRLLGAKISLKRIAIMSVPLLIILSLVGFIRMRLDAIGDEGLFENYSVFESLIGASGTDEVLRFLVECDFDNWQYGKTFYAALANFVPRQMWGEKPFGAGPLVANFIKPGSYDLGLSNITSQTTGIVSESYMNFGFLGPVILGICLAVVAFYIKGLKVKGFYHLCIKSHLIVIFGFAIFYSEFLGLFARGLFVIVPLIISIVIVTMHKGFRAA